MLDIKKAILEAIEDDKNYGRRDNLSLVLSNLHLADQILALRHENARFFEAMNRQDPDYKHDESVQILQKINRNLEENQEMMNWVYNAIREK